MKKLLLILIVIGLISVFSGCKKKSNSTATLTTTVISSITGSSVVSGGNITSDGGTTITARGVCWSTSSNPTVALTTKTSDSTGMGSYTSSITGLLPTTTYYAKAYAINSAGTAYGNELSFTTMPSIGDAFLGGKLAYILQPSDSGYDPAMPHGLIAAPSDQSTGIQWYNGSYVATNATGTAIGTGFANTSAIIASQGGGSYAATICKNLTLGGYTDWYLPSKGEWFKLNSNRTLIGGFSSNNTYWSSTEFNDSIAWGQVIFTIYTGGQSIGAKDLPNRVRAVRSF